MKDPKLSKRIDLLKQLLKRYIDIENDINAAESQLEETSGRIHAEYIAASQDEKNRATNKFSNNIEEANIINTLITAEINDWYQFIKDEKSMSSLTFPLKFYFKRKKLFNDIKKANEKIQNLSINNRFIKENLNFVGQELGNNSSSKLKNLNSYSEYEKLQRKRDNLITELKYLIPTIPGLCPIELSSGKAAEIIDMMSDDESA